MNKLNTWADLKKFANSLTEEQLKQPVKIYGEGHSETASFVEVFKEDMINPSGDGCEPVSVYLNDPEYGKEYVEGETVIYKAGVIMITAD